MDVTTGGERWAQAALLCLVAVLLGILVHQTIERDRADARFMPAAGPEEVAALLEAQRAALAQARHRAPSFANLPDSGDPGPSHGCRVTASVRPTERRHARAEPEATPYRSSSPNGSPAGMGAGRS